MWCEVELKKLSANGDNTLISGLRLNGNNDGKMVVSDKYQNNSEQIYFGGPSRDSEFDVFRSKKTNLIYRASPMAMGKSYSRY